MVVSPLLKSMVASICRSLRKRAIKKEEKMLKNLNNFGKLVLILIALDLICLMFIIASIMSGDSVAHIAFWDVQLKYILILLS